MANEVNVFFHTDTGAPTLTGEAGSLLALLDKILVDGYTPASVTSITRSGTVATVTLASADSSLTDQGYYTISGADQAAYNGKKRITVVDSTHFTFEVAGSPDSPATGTIVCGKSAAGWTKPYTGTNKAAYQTGAANNPTQVLLRVEDNGPSNGTTRDARVTGYESMTDVDAGSGSFGGSFWRKSVTTDATARPWTAIADDRSLYLSIAGGSGSQQVVTVYFFGRFTSVKTGDAFPYVCTGNTASPATDTTVNNGFTLGYITSSLNQHAGVALCRAASQVAGAINGCGMVTAGSSIVVGGAVSSLTYPNPADGALWSFPYFLTELSNSLRGQYPGCLMPWHSSLVGNNRDLVTDVMGYPGRKFMMLVAYNSSSAGRVMVDITGPWD
jgi:hypothetical protein